MHALFFALTLIASPLVWAQPASGVVLKQVIGERQRAVAEVTGPGEPATMLNQEFIASFPSGRQCLLKVISQKGALLSLDTSTCELRGELRSGMTVEPLLLADAGEQVAPPPSPESNGESGARIRLGELGYQAPRGRTVIALGGAIRKVNSTLTYQNRTYEFSQIASQAIAFDLSYGLSDKLSASIAFASFLSDTTDTTDGPASVDNGKNEVTKSSGFSDPEIGARYRLLNQNEQPLNGIVEFAFRPAIFEAKNATTKANGTMGAGGHSVALQLRISKNMDRYGFELKSGYRINDKRTKKNASTEKRTEYTGGHIFNFGILGLYKLSEFVSATAGLDWLSVAAMEAVAIDNGRTKISFSDFESSTFSFGLQLIAIPDQLLLRFDYQSIPSYSTKLSAIGVELPASVSGSAYFVGGVYAF